MNKVVKKTINSFTALFFMAGITIFTEASCLFLTVSIHLPFPVYAAEEEEEEEWEYENEEEEEDEESSSQTLKKTKSTPIYKTILVTKVITTLDPIFETDKDADGLVDGLDPHPAMHEREYFTDDDDDSIPNAFDKYKDDDDFVYYEGEKDENEDGILDSYEFMAER